MDEKTEELREIFMDVAEDETVTERQEEPPGSLAPNESVEERLRELLGRMQSAFSFDSPMDDSALATVARGFYADRSDESISEELGVSPDAVFRARLDLHLLKDSDRDGPVDYDALRRAVVAADTDPSRVFDVDRSVLERHLAIVDAEQEMRRANYRFRDQFDDLLGDGDVAPHLTRGVTDDGLAEATEGIEINTGF